MEGVDAWSHSHSAEEQRPQRRQMEERHGVEFRTAHNGLGIPSQLWWRRQLPRSPVLSTL